MPSIFISYRRADAPGHAGRIYDRLVERFGRDNVYMDLDSTPPGADFAEVINATVARCDALIAVIGRDWLSTEERESLGNPQDWVRREIHAALQRGIPVIPVLVEGARLPNAAELPDEIAGLTRRQAVELTETGWNPQLSQLIASLETGAPTPRLRRAVRIVALLSIAAVAVSLGVAALVGEPEGAAVRDATPTPTPTADEYRLSIVHVCEDHTKRAKVIEELDPSKPPLGATVELDRRTVAALKVVRAPREFVALHREIVALWGRRVSLLTHIYGLSDDPPSGAEADRMIMQLDGLARRLHKIFTQLDALPECDFFEAA